MTIPGIRNYDNNRTEQTKASKNGYEIRSDILALAQQHVHFEYEQGLRKGITSVPSVSDVLKVANEYYDFVNQNRK